MFAISKIAKKVSSVAGGALLLAMLTAATCEGEGFVRTDNLPPGKCVLLNPVTNRNPAAGGANDILQLTDVNDSNNFIQCQLLASVPNDQSVNVIIAISPQDAIGHAFVNTDQPATILNLSRN
jgi:hypothetical protein